MKLLFQLGIALAILLSSLQSEAQDSKSDKLYNIFAGKDGVLTLSLSKSVLKPLEIFLDNDTRQIIYKMEKVRFMAYNENKGDLTTLQVFKRIKKELQNGRYFNIDPEELELDDHDIEYDHLLLIGHGHKNHMDEFHLIVYEDDHCVLFSFFGDIDLNDLNECHKFSHSARKFIDL